MVQLPDGLKLDTFDYEDSKQLFAFGVETANVAREYQTARKTFAISLKCLKIGVAKAYGLREIERKISEDKAYLILAEGNPIYREALEEMLDSEAQYKGLEKVLETRQSVMSLAQSLIKNKLEST